MSSRISALCLSVLLSTVATAALADQPAAAGQSSDRHIALINDIPAYLDQLHQTVKMAKAGEYGHVKSRDMDRIEMAQSQIEIVLRDRTDGSGLTEEQQEQVFNAQETISAIVRDNDGNRIVCTREKGTGTRLTAQECMTVAERKARAEKAREQAKNLIGNNLQDNTY